MLERSKAPSRFLDIPLLNLGDETEKVAYLYDLDVGTDRLMNGYFKLYLKDINGNVAIARMFNVPKGDKDIYAEAKTLKGHAIKVRFRVDSYNGSLTFTVISFERYNQLVDYAQFVGEIDGVDSIAATVKEIFRQYADPNPDIPELYKTESFFDLCDGKAGGYIKLVEVVLLSISALRGVPGIDYVELIKVWYTVQRGYYEYLKRLKVIDVITTADKLNIIYKFREQTDSVSVDTLCALIGIAQPQTMQSIIISNAVKYAKDSMRLACVYDSMLTGSVKREGDLTLLKY